MAGRYDIKCDQGSTFRRVFTWKDSTGALINNAGYSAKMEVRPVTGGAPVLTASTANAKISLGGAAGTITVTFSATDTNGVTAGFYAYDLEMTSGTGDITRILEGDFHMRKQVTL